MVAAYSRLAHDVKTSQKNKALNNDYSKALKKCMVLNERAPKKMGNLP
jgi:hypothetical protein